MIEHSNLPGPRANLELLAQIIESISEERNRKNEDFKILCRGLSHCWSIAIAANPKKANRHLKD